jgi:hypothetical protein
VAAASVRADGSYAQRNITPRTAFKNAAAAATAIAAAAAASADASDSTGFQSRAENEYKGHLYMLTYCLWRATVGVLLEGRVAGGL